MHAALSEFRCKKKCPYGQNDALHPISARGQGSKFNAAAIPQALAEEVAAYVAHKFYRDRIRHTEVAEMTPSEIAEFNAVMSRKSLSVTKDAIADAAGAEVTMDVDPITEASSTVEGSTAASEEDTAADGESTTSNAPASSGCALL